MGQAKAMPLQVEPPVTRPLFDRPPKNASCLSKKVEFRRSLSKGVFWVQFDTTVMIASKLCARHLLAALRV